MLRCLFVTSFNRDIYLATGKNLVRSFCQYAVDARLLACHEQTLASEIHPSSQRLITYDLDRSEFLHSWLESNKDCIPVTLGGSVEQCDCPSPHDPFGNHRARCAWSWFNKNASRWFRKIVALDHALRIESVDAIVWIDSDCCFLKPLPLAEIEAWFGDGSVFFLRGPDRPVLEAGVIGFRTDADGRAVLNSAIERFRGGRFRQDSRWDDGYQLQMALQENSADVVTDWGRSADERGHVVSGSRLGEFIAHDKGTHKYSGIMT
jgi:hypothetical protein